MTSEEFQAFANQCYSLEEVKITTMDTDSNEDEAVKGILKQCTKRYVFTGLPIDKSVINWMIRRYIKSKYLDKNGKVKYFSGKVTGYTQNNNKISFDFNRNTKDYLDFEYDDIGKVDSENLDNHVIIRKMIESLNQDIIFGG